MGRVHTEGLRRLGNVEVTGVAARTDAAARKFADAMGIPKATANYEELLADPELDAVHICTPNDLHFPMAKAALEAGKAVLCEKPLASTVEEAQSMIDLAKKKDLANCTFYNVRFYPQVQNMRAIREAYGSHIALPTLGWMIEIGAWLMRTESELILKSRRVVPGRLLEAGFSFAFPDWPGAARDLVARWRKVNR